MLFGKFKAAAAVFELAVRENSDYAYSYYYLGTAYEKLGNRIDAVKAYQTAIRKGGNSRPAIDAAFQLKYLRMSK